MPDNFLHLVIIVAIVLIVLKLIKATGKLMITAVLIAVVVWVVMQVANGGITLCIAPSSLPALPVCWL